VIIINADDFGRSEAETDAILECHERGRVTSASAMVFMNDCDRAATLARKANLHLGLHLNLSDRFTGANVPGQLRADHTLVVRFLTAHKYALLFYNPFLKKQFAAVYQAQLDEFARVYATAPSHIDGHHHKHLCQNVLLGGVIPAGETVRRDFSYWPGEKSLLARGYRWLINRSLERKYIVTRYFFSLRECLETGRLSRVFRLARSFDVELMTHPSNRVEYEYLMSDRHEDALSQLSTGSYWTMKGRCRTSASVSAPISGPSCSNSF
jgi:chitin disaccharide deacetylase